MTGIDIPTAETSKLVAYFSELALARFNAERRGDIESYNQYFDILSAVEEELKARSGDQRTALVPLLGRGRGDVKGRARFRAAGFAGALERKNIPSGGLCDGHVARVATRRAGADLIGECRQVSKGPDGFNAGARI